MAFRLVAFFVIIRTSVEQNGILSAFWPLDAASGLEEISGLFSLNRMQSAGILQTQINGPFNIPSTSFTSPVCMTNRMGFYQVARNMDNEQFSIIFSLFRPSAVQSGAVFSLCDKDDECIVVTFSATQLKATLHGATGASYTLALNSQAGQWETFVFSYERRVKMTFRRYHTTNGQLLEDEFGNGISNGQGGSLRIASLQLGYANVGGQEFYLKMNDSLSCFGMTEGDFTNSVLDFLNSCRQKHLLNNQTSSSPLPSTANTPANSTSTTALTTTTEATTTTTSSSTSTSTKPTTSTTSKPPLFHSLLALWPFNLPFGLKDVSGNDMHGTEVGTLLLPSGSQGWQTSNSSYIKIVSDMLPALSEQSFTLIGHVQMKSTGPIFEWSEEDENSLCLNAHFWRYSNKDSLYFYSGPTGVDNSTTIIARQRSCPIKTGMQLVGLTYQGPNQECYIWCDTKFVGPMLNCSYYPFTNTFFFGYREGTKKAKSIGAVSTFSCWALFSSVLNASEIGEMTKLCDKYIKKHLPNAKPKSCQANFSSPLSFTCECYSGWTGDDCSTIIPGQCAGVACESVAGILRKYMAASNSMVATNGEALENGTVVTVSCEPDSKHNSTCIWDAKSGGYGWSPALHKCCSDTERCFQRTQCTEEKCLCREGWKGIECRDPHCTGDCYGHGECRMPEICRCWNRFGGTNCNVTLTEPYQNFSQISPKFPSLLALYPLTKQFGLNDISPNNHSLSISAASLSSYSVITGPFNAEQGLSTDPNGNHFIYDKSMPNSQSFTIAAFVRAANTSMSPLFEFEQQALTQRGTTLWQAAYNTELSFCTEGKTCHVNMKNCSTNRWQFLALIYDKSAGKCRLFCENKIWQQEIDCGPGNEPVTGILHFGYAPQKLNFNAQSSRTFFSCISIFQSALSQEELILAGKRCDLQLRFTVQNIVENTCASNSSAPIGFTCRCKDSWAGELCNIRVCHPPCQNNGTCQPETQTCTCQPGWTGDRCEVRTCTLPCQNGGTCLNATLTCSCPSEWTDPDCSRHIATPTVSTVTKSAIRSTTSKISITTALSPGGNLPNKEMKDSKVPPRDDFDGIDMIPNMSDMLDPVPFMDLSVADLVSNCSAVNPLNRSPPPYKGSSVKLQVKLALDRLVEVDDVSETVSVSSILISKWSIFTCQISSPSDMNNRLRIMDIAEIWHPALMLKNAKNDVALKNDLLVDRMEVGFFYDKFFFFEWSKRGILHSVCSFNLRAFPYDQQDCDFVFNLVEPVKLVEIWRSNLTLPMQQLSFQSWTFVEGSSRISTIMDAEGENVSQLKFTITIRRNPDYFTFNLLAPCILLTCLSLVTFFIHPSESDRVLFNVYLVLALAVCLVQVTRKLPKTTQHVMLYDYCQLCALTCIFSTLYAAFMVWMWSLKRKLLRIAILKRPLLRLQTLLEIFGFSIGIVIFMSSTFYCLSLVNY